MDDEVTEPARQRQVDPAVRAVREHLLYFLGLVPVSVAGMRVYLMAQGDVGTMFTLIKTLDLRDLFLGTFIRFIGVFGVVSTVYVFVRLYWPRLMSATAAAGQRPVGWSGLSVLILVFLASVGCLYPEQLLDTSNGSPGPVDFARATGWVIGGYVLLRLVRFPPLRQQPRHRRGNHEKDLPTTKTGVWLRRELRRLAKPELWLVAPAVLLLFWGYLVTNDRMWLPPQVVVLRTAPVGLSAGAGGIDPVERRPNGDVAFIGFVVDSDLVEVTILRPGGGVVVTRRDNVADLVTCQYEPDFDPNADMPLIGYLPGFHRLNNQRINPVCIDALSAG